MHPREFKETWTLTNAELAQLLGYKPDSVNNWFRERDPVEIPQSVFSQLQIWHNKFRQWEDDRDLPPHARQIYEVSLTRRLRRQFIN